MRIARHFTTASLDPYEGVAFEQRRIAHRQSGRLGRLRGDRHHDARELVAGRRRHHGAEVLPQGRRARRAAAHARGRRARMALALRGRTDLRRLGRRIRRAPGLRPPRRHLDVLGLEARLLRRRRGRAQLPRRALLHDGDPAGGAELAAVVQHRPALGLRHRRPGAGPLVCRPRERRGATLHQRLRAPAAARLLHPVGRRRPRQRGRDHGPLDARGAHLQVWLRHRVQLLQAPRRGRAALRRRQVVRADVVPQDRRPRRGGDQVRRHHTARGEDGDRRCRSPGHRGVHRLEGERRTESRGAGHGLARHATPLECHLRGGGRRRRPDCEAAAPQGAGAGAAGRRSGGLRAARAPARRAGRAGGRLRPVRLRLAGCGLPDRLRPERQQLRARDRRLPARRARGPALGTHASHGRRGASDGGGARSVGPRRPGGVAVGRPRGAVRHHDQRVAHSAGAGANRGLEPLLRVHVPGRHPRATSRRSTCCGSSTSGAPERTRAPSTWRPSSTRRGCGRWCSRSRC